MMWKTRYAIASRLGKMRGYTHTGKFWFHEERKFGWFWSTPNGDGFVTRKWIFPPKKKIKSGMGSGSSAQPQAA